MTLTVADFDEDADAIGYAVREWIANGGGLKDAMELLAGVG